MPAVALLIELHPDELQTLANTFADRRRVLADSAREHERIQSAERARKRRDPFLGLIAKNADRLRGAHVLALAPQQVPDVRARLGDPEKSRFVVHQPL